MSTISSSTTSSTAYKVAADTTGTLVLQTGATPTTAVYIDTSQNVGVGVTPSAWLSNRRALEIGGGASAVLALNGTAAVAEIFTNSYRNAAGTYIYAQNGYAGYMNYNNQAGGGWAWSLAPSGSAGGTATFTQAMTLDASGNLLVGQTSQSQTTVGASLAQSGVFVTAMAASTNATNTFQIYSTGAGAFRFYVDLGGTIHATATSIAAISDATLKTNIKDLETGLTEVLALKPRRFDWINGDATNVAGFIAQEVEQVLPELVIESLYSKDENDNKVTKKNLKMGDILPTLVKAIQEQQALITQLQADVAALKGAA